MHDFNKFIFTNFEYMADNINKLSYILHYLRYNILFFYFNSSNLIYIYRMKHKQKN